MKDQVEITKEGLFRCTTTFSPKKTELKKFGFLIFLIRVFLGENVVVQRNSPSLVISTWSLIESQIRVYGKIENNTQ